MDNKTLQYVRKRDGSKAEFSRDKITEAIFKAAGSVGGSNRREAAKLADLVVALMEEAFPSSHIPHVEEVQDIVEKVLIENGHAKTAKSYILYRARRAKEREEEVTQKVESEHAEQGSAESPGQAVAEMFTYTSKLSRLVPKERIETYRRLYYLLKDMIAAGELPSHPNYLGDNELAENIYRNKYYLKDFKGECIEGCPEDVFARLASYIAAVEPTEDTQKKFAIAFYKDLYHGSYLPGGRVMAGAGDLYRLKTLANCFVSLIQGDDIESIFGTAYECARTYSYGGGIGVDISNLRPTDSIVHNAADRSTGAVSFMELYSLTTGLIGQSGRRGALMLTMDVKHPDILRFIDVKKIPNWVTKQVIKQCEWTGKFSQAQLGEIETQVRDNTQVRFANISIKVSDEFMGAVDEQITYGENAIMVYKKYTQHIVNDAPQNKTLHYSYGIPSKNLEDYSLEAGFNTLQDANTYLKEKYHIALKEADLAFERRDVFGDFVVPLEHESYHLAIHRSGDFMLYFSSSHTGEIKRLVKARDVWNRFIASNYKTAEPGLIFWSTMVKYSPSNCLGVPIASTNPCGEVPLEDGGACNLGSINLSRFVKGGYTEEASIDWKGIQDATSNLVRFLDNVISWNSVLNPLEKQRAAASSMRRIGLGIMGVADMLNQLGIGYDSEEGIKLMEKVSSVIANSAYGASAMIAAEKGSFPLFNLEQYAKNRFFIESLAAETREAVVKHGLRNVAILSIAPTGTISNAILGFTNKARNYVGVSGGIEPIFSLYYTRRSESFNKFFKVFHPTVQAYIDLKEMNTKVQDTKDIDDLQKLLPSHFFRTAHFIAAEKRVVIQAICQKYIDHSISSTVNLPESVDPETITNIYLNAWKQKLKGITIYRDGSRYPILSIEAEQTEFKDIKEKQFRYLTEEGEQIVKGDEVVVLPNAELSTPFHLMKNGKPNDIILEEISAEEQLVQPEVPVSGKVCKVKFENGKLVKDCGD